MFIIQTSPLGSNKTLAEYGKFLLRRFAVTYFSRGAMEVHIIFDNPDNLSITPKCFEQQRRDGVNDPTHQHYCDNVQASTKIPPGKWHEQFLKCRSCKRKLVQFLGGYFLSNIGKHIQQNQSLYVAGCFDGDIVNTAWYVSGTNRRQPHPEFSCDAPETDTRLWLHATMSSCSQVLIISHDTDVYHIGLPLPCIREKQIYVQVSPLSSHQLKILNLSALTTALANDPDLAHIDQTIRPRLLQTLYVASGCDYTSFFSQTGKATFMRYFYQHASFINSTTEGTLADTDLTDLSYNRGYLAFIRLVGAIYFKKYTAAFNAASPELHFVQFQIETRTTHQQHTDWLDDIRQNIWYRVKFENEMLPSNQALGLHWRRTCWVLDMWHQATLNTVKLKPLIDNGWSLTAGHLSIVWDTDENIQAVKERVDSILRGCKCAGGCKTRRCGCKRSGKLCAYGCECTNCLNLDKATQSEQQEFIDIVNYEEFASSDNITTENIMDWVFDQEDSD